MVSPIAYVRTYTGIDISLPLEDQDISAVDAALMARRERPRRVGTTPTGKEAIYDAVVGIDRVGNCGFDRASDQPARLRTAALQKLSELATGLQERSDGAAGRDPVLQSIVQVTNKYKALLQGTRAGVAKDRVVIGSRHTLISSGNGDIFEMTNSMTKAEMARFRRKSNMHVSAVERADRLGADKFDAEPMHRIVLGVGSFGKARIARNICTDQYVAVKKSHPTIAIYPGEGLVSQSPTASQFSRLPGSMQGALRRVSDAVITPDAELLCQSRKSVELNKFGELLNEKRDVDGMSMEQFREFLALRNHPAVKNLNVPQTQNALIDGMEAVICCKVPPLNTDTETLYSFSEIGLGNLRDAAETMGTLCVHFETGRSVSELSVEAVALLENYAQAYGAPHPELTTAELKQLRRRQGIEMFSRPDFYLKDLDRNKKYYNTLGKKLITALAKFHSTQLSHRDVKPANIVFCQDADENISVKLIDIDSIEIGLKTKEKADSGTPLYMAPELLLLRDDNTAFFDAEKSDSYAMGLTLRAILGSTEEEVEIVTLSQAEKSFTQRARGEARKNITRQDQENLDYIREILQDHPLSPGMRVHTPARNDRNASLKDVSDFLLQSRTEDRRTASDVVALDFFNDPENFLNDTDFTKQTNFILRFQAIVDTNSPGH